MAEGGGDKVSPKARAGLVKTPDPVPHHDTRKELAELAHVSELYSWEAGRRGNGAREVTGYQTRAAFSNRRASDAMPVS